MKRILLTGASGRIGRAVYEELKDDYQLTLCDIREPAFKLSNGDLLEKADLSSASNCDRLVKGHDVVVHLAGVPDPAAPFESLLPANLLATTYLLAAAARYGCERFVFASSAQAIEGYPLDVQVADGSAPNPANLYGAIKAYGEALCGYHAKAHDLSSVSLRIGAFEEKGSLGITTQRDLSAWLSPRDSVHLIRCAIEAKVDGHFVGHGISDNRFKRMDLTGTRKTLGYSPKDDAFRDFNWPDS